MPFFDNQSRDELRRVYVEAWRKRRAGLPVEPLEAQVADVIALHPEYHAALERGADTLERDYTRLSKAQELATLASSLAAGLAGDSSVLASISPLVRK